MAPMRPLPMGSASFSQSVAGLSYQSSDCAPAELHAKSTARPRKDLRTTTPVDGGSYATRDARLADYSFPYLANNLGYRRARSSLSSSNGSPLGSEGYGVTTRLISLPILAR